MSDRPISLLLIEEDPIFRLGLVTALMGINSVTVIAQADSPTAAREQLKSQIPDVILMEPINIRGTNLGWEFCLELQKNYSTLKICLLTASLDYPRLTLAQDQGIAGYFPKGTVIADLVRGIEQIAIGERYWSSMLPTLKPKVKARNKILKPLFQTGLGQIEESLAEVNTHLAQRPLSDFDRLFWQGRRRELITARWCVKRLIPDYLQTPTNPPPTTVRLDQPVISPITKAAIAPNDLTSLPVKLTLDKLNFPNLNLTPTPLELDILQPIKRQELLQLVLTQIERVIQELKKLEVTPEQLPDNCNLLLVEIWQSVTLSFFGKYCSPKQDYPIDSIQALLTTYKTIVQTEALDKIPFVQAIFEYLLFAKESTELSSSQKPQNIEICLHNLVIQLANSVIVFILNYFPDNEDIKQTLYQQKLLSSREIAKLRNDLAWRYQLNQYWLEPRNIFESQYQLFYFTPQGINVTAVYAPRQAELRELVGIPWAVTILLELRDALAPRFRTLVKFLGNGFIFLLTQVIGRAIGLIVKGVLQGIGNSWQDSRFQRNYKSNLESDRRQENSSF